ncbi:porin family protein [Spirosoma pollinicola]|uniref:Outer membrane protein beta-barrel domain-containing protein n=1 Tax=Spirosoma pollinicola TaxID=2057025 RepID=A0A2K8ZBZ5_9BACT|nr:hypothetical protein [Spirosoma pollinicola]AUD07385.1 hypothetical protein CWM47_19350 [Spirosoma pollinicola]
MNTNLRLLLALLCLPTTVLLGQQKLSMSVTVAPTLSHTNYNYRFFYPNSDGQVVEPVYMNGPRWANGYSAGLSLLYTYAPDWTVSSGVWFQQVTTRQARQAASGEGTVTVHNRIVRIPLLLSYTSSMKRLSPYFSLGLLTDVPIPSRVIVTRTGQSTQYLGLENSRRPIFHLLVGAGVQYKLNRRYTLMAQPVWTYKFGQLGGASTYDASFEVSMLTQVAYTF